MAKELCIFVCDDEPEGRRALVQGVKAAFPEELYVMEAFARADDVCRAMERMLPDIAVLDIQLQQDNGITLAGEILRRSPRCRILFVSGYVEYAPDVYDVEHVCFILKAQLEQRLPLFLSRAYAQICAEKARVLRVHLNGGERILPQDEILYLESARRMVKIVTQTASLSVYGKLDELEKKLDAVRFVRCHKSYIVGLDHVAAYSRTVIQMSNGDTISVSRSCRDAVQAGYMRYLQAKESIL